MPRFRPTLATIQAALAPLRYGRASLWTALFQLIAGSLLWGVSQPGKGPYGTDPDVLFFGTLAFWTYLAAVTLGHVGLGAYLVARGRYSTLRAWALQMLAVVLVLLALVPASIVVLAPATLGFETCPTLQCAVLILLGVVPIVAALVLAGVAPISLLWFFLARPATSSLGNGVCRR